MRPHCVVAQHWIRPEQRRSEWRVNLGSAPSFIEQELAGFSNDQRLVYHEHIVVGVMQFDDSRVLHACAEALDCAFYLLRERLDVATEFLLCLPNLRLTQPPLHCDVLKHRNPR